MYGGLSAPFPVSAGVRQGCVLSPILFNYVIDWLMSTAIGDFKGVEISTGQWISDLEYADDIVVFGASTAELQPVLDRIRVQASRIGLQINTAKTKYFSAQVTIPSPPLRIGTVDIEEVDSFQYLGSNIRSTGQGSDEIKLRVDKARRSFMQLFRNLWNRREISLRTKLRVFEASVRSVLVYGCETWPLRVEDVRKLESFDHWCLRIIAKIKWSDFISNDEVRLRCYGITRLGDLLQKRRLQWFGHVVRRDEGELVRQVVDPKPKRGWKCRLGGQVKTWLATVKRDVDKLGLVKVHGLRKWQSDWVSICTELASDRSVWRAAIRDISEAD